MPVQRSLSTVMRRAHIYSHKWSVSAEAHRVPHALNLCPARGPDSTSRCPTRTGRGVRVPWVSASLPRTPSLIGAVTMPRFLPRVSRRRRAHPSKKLPKSDWRRGGQRCRFEFLEPLRMLNAVSWSGGATGNWNVAANWTGLSVGETAPGLNDDVTINGSVTVTHNSVSDEIHSLTLGTGATLDINGGSAITLLLSSGTALSDDGTINLGDAAGASAGALFFDGDQTLAATSGATGSVVLGGNPSNELIQGLGGQTLAIGSGIAIKGGDGLIGNGAATLVNNGTIDADTSGGTINVALGVNGSNSGTVEAGSGASLTVSGNSSGTWTNKAGATISITGGG